MSKPIASMGGALAIFLLLASAATAEAADNVDRADRSQRLDSDSIRNDVREERLTVPQHPLFPQPLQAEPSAKSRAKSKHSMQR
jgi:hypothetical protein